MLKRALVAILLIALVLLPLGCAGGCDGENPHHPPIEGQRALGLFVGAWKHETTINDKKATPNESKKTAEEITTWALKNKFIVGKEILHPDGIKSLWLATWDESAKKYRVWLFEDAGGQIGTEVSLTWDSNKRRMSGQLPGLPKGWTGESEDLFPDNDTINWKLWIKDDKGASVLSMQTTKKRQSKETGEKTLTAWLKKDKSINEVPQPVELLYKLTGKWTETQVSKKSEWNPKETKRTVEIERKVILNGWYLLETGKHSDGKEHLILWTWDPHADPEKGRYRTWRFDSDGKVTQTKGVWGPTNTLYGPADFENGITGTSQFRLVDDDHYEWTVTGKDKAGKVYVERVVTAKRKGVVGDQPQQGEERSPKPSP